MMLKSAFLPLILAGWDQDFINRARTLMGTPLCATLQGCADTMSKWHQDYIGDDKSNNYVTLAFCGAVEDDKPDENGNVWWYDHKGDKDNRYWIADAIQEPGTSGLGDSDPCGDKGMYVRGVQVDVSISQEPSPDWRHAKWDISHEQPLFDYTPHPDCDKSNDPQACQKANPCGKADVLNELWRENIKKQLYGSNIHMLITICDKDGDWDDNAADCADPKSQNCKTPKFNKDVSSMIGFSIFPPNSAEDANDVWDHVEWDKAPRDTID